MFDSLTDLVRAWTAYAVFLTAFGGICAYVYRKLRTLVQPVHKQIDALSELANAQLTTNGGTSLLDKINKIAGNHTTAEAHWDKLEEGQVKLASDLRETTGVLFANHEEMSKELAINTDLTQAVNARVGRVEEEARDERAVLRANQADMASDLKELTAEKSRVHVELDQRLDRIDGILVTAGADLHRRETAILDRLDAIDKHASTTPADVLDRLDAIETHTAGTPEDGAEDHPSGGNP